MFEDSHTMDFNTFIAYVRQTTREQLQDASLEDLDKFVEFLHMVEDFYKEDLTKLKFKVVDDHLTAWRKTTDGKNYQQKVPLDFVDNFVKNLLSATATMQKGSQIVIENDANHLFVASFLVKIGLLDKRGENYMLDYILNDFASIVQKELKQIKE